MRLIFAILFLLSIDAFATQIRIANGGGTYSVTTTWDGGVVPTSVDTVIADGSSGQLTVSSSDACKALLLTGYTSTLTINSTLNVYGSATFSSGMTTAGAGTLYMRTTGTITSNNVTLSGALRRAANVVVTLSDTWHVLGSITIDGGGSTAFLSDSIYVSGSVVGSTSNGSTTFVMVGTGTISGTLYHPIVMNTSGTITITASGIGGTNGASASSGIKWISGTVITPASISILGSGGTASYIDVNSSTSAHPSTTSSTGINFNNLTLSGNINITGSLAAAGNVVMGAGAGMNGGNLYCSGSFTNPSSGLSSGGTAVVNMIGTGTLSTGTADIPWDINMNTTEAITIGNLELKSPCTVTYISGNIDVTNCILNLATGVSFDTDGMTWGTVTHSASSSTVTLLSSMKASKYTVYGSPTWQGSFGFDVDTLNGLQSGWTLTLENGVEYFVNNYIGATGGTIKSDDATIKTLLTIDEACTEELNNLNGTRVDSSNGKFVNSPGGVLIETINWGVLLGGNPIFID